MNAKSILIRAVKPRGKSAFFNFLDPFCRVLDVGCGNDSPLFFKRRFPSGHYTGVDIGDYRHSGPIMADNYVVTTPEGFSNEIAKFKNEFDAVFSSHNLEHCNDREGTLAAIAGALKANGRLYLSFPSEASTRFPSRVGSLNYRDDSTHLGTPPSMDATIALLENHGLKIEFQSHRYRPIVLACIGFILEPLSRIQGRVRTGTWELYGFEAIIWARKQ